MREREIYDECACVFVRERGIEGLEDCEGGGREREGVEDTVGGREREGGKKRESPQAE